MFKIIDLYIARTLLSTVAVTLSVLIGLSALIKFVEQLRRVGQGDYDMTLAALYDLLSLPREIELFLPMATLLGGLIGMGLLAQSSELVVMQASGLSRAKITMSAMKSIVVVIIAIMALGEFVTPKSEAKAKQIRTQALSGGSVLSGDSLTWAKDGNDNELYILQARPETVKSRGAAQVLERYTLKGRGKTLVEGRSIGSLDVILNKLPVAIQADCFSTAHETSL